MKVSLVAGAGRVKRCLRQSCMGARENRAYASDCAVGEQDMIRAVSPDDSPRIKIIERAHPSLVNFKHSYWQVFLGHCVPQECPLEEWPHGGWVLHIPAEQPLDRLAS